MAKGPVGKAERGKPGAKQKSPKGKTTGAMTLPPGFATGMEELFDVLLEQVENSRWTPEIDEAQEIALEAMEAPTSAKRIALARKALALSPLCADAYSILAAEAKNPEDEVLLLRQAVEAGAKSLGEDAFVEDAGMFWGVLETRPYMRALQQLAVVLWEVGERDEALRHYRELLRLNPNDNQGNRYLLMDALLESGADDEAVALLKRYKDDGTAAWDWSKALLTFRRKGNSAAARKDLSRAIESNPHVVGYLLGREPLPAEEPEFIGYGDKSEAATYVPAALVAWRATSGALEWVEAAAAPLATGRVPEAEALSEEDRVDDAVLALLLLGLHDGNRAWKTFDWDALGRLHEKGMVENPAGKAKSVALTDEGLRRAEILFDRLFGEPSTSPPTIDPTTSKRKRQRPA